MMNKFGLSAEEAKNIFFTYSTLNRMDEKVVKAIETIIEVIFEWSKHNKKWILIFFLFELWVHSLIFSHLWQLRRLEAFIPGMDITTTQQIDSTAILKHFHQ